MSSFCDQVNITFKAGDGGPGAIAFRREKFVAYGGPDGGDGGKGGDIVLQVNPNINTLIDFQAGHLYEAESGIKGYRFNMAGRAAEDLVVDVPPGTQIYNPVNGQLTIDLVEPWSRCILLKGGKGGFGNAHFKSSIRQAPDFAELGEPGKTLEVRLEMRMVADVGIIGLPSVGKSTLISRISNAKPKIADYPFTTLVPNMGVVDFSKWGGGAGESFVVADIPGLIEGAHLGKGLGHEFLRHISRTALLVHMLDCQAQDMTKDFQIIMNELKTYDPELAKRPQIIVVNKIDTIDEETQTLVKKDLQAFLKKKKVKAPLFFISGVSGSGLKEVIHQLWKEVQAFRARTKTLVQPSEHSKESYRVFRPHLDSDTKAFTVSQSAVQTNNVSHTVFVISGPRLDQIVSMTDVDNPSAVHRVHDVLKKMGIQRELIRRGAQVGDKIQIFGHVFDFRE
jgi:GTP-binding protein